MERSPFRDRAPRGSQTVDYRRSAYPLTTGNRSGATCFACGSARVICSVMVGTVGGETRSFLVCDRCHEMTLGRLSEWVAGDTERRWLTMGVALAFSPELAASVSS